MTLQERERLRELLAKATPLPYCLDIHRPGPGGAVVHRDAMLAERWPHREIAAVPFSNPEPKLATRVANMELLLAAVNSLPALLADSERAQRLEAALRQARAAIEGTRHSEACTKDHCACYKDAALSDIDAALGCGRME